MGCSMGVTKRRPTSAIVLDPVRVWRDHIESGIPICELRRRTGASHKLIRDAVLKGRRMLDERAAQHARDVARISGVATQSVPD
jgi:hypothetical protein